MRFEARRRAIYIPKRTIPAVQQNRVRRTVVIGIHMVLKKKSEEEQQVPDRPFDWSKARGQESLGMRGMTLVEKMDVLIDLNVTDSSPQSLRSTGCLGLPWHFS